MQQSGQALSKLLLSFSTSGCYPQLQLLRLKLLKPSNPAPSSVPKNQSAAKASEAAAEAVAADWVCLLWLLQTAPAEVAKALTVEWQKHQMQEFTTWVRPASELHAVRSKAAAKVCEQTFLHAMHRLCVGLRLIVRTHAFLHLGTLRWTGAACIHRNVHLILVCDRSVPYTNSK